MADDTAKKGTTGPKKHYKRRVRNILIHKPMQREFTLILVALLMVSSLAIGFVIHDTIHEAAFGGGFRFGKINPYEVLSEVRYQIIIKVTSILFVTLIVIGIFAVFFLHRVAGPVYRFRQTFLSLNDGELPREVKLREGDFFNETASEINLHIQRLKKNKEEMAAVKDVLAQVGQSNKGDETSKKAAEILQLIESRGEDALPKKV